MRRRNRPPALITIAAALIAPFAAPRLAALQPDAVDAILSAYRRVIVLADAAQRGPVAQQPQRLAVARAVYAGKEQALQLLQNELEELLRSAGETGSARLASLVERLGESATLQAGDRLAFVDLLVALENTARQQQAGELADRLRRLRDEIEAARERFDREAESSERMRGGSRPQWNEYVRRIRSVADADVLLQEEHAHESEVLRGTHPGEVSGRELPASTVILTFDDGPHPKYTREILDILAAARVHAMFFQVGQRLGSVGDKGTPVALTPLASLTRQIVAAGHVVANHSYSHRAMGSLAASQQTMEVAATNALLALISGEAPRFFRPPYGARNTALLDRVTALEMQSIMWNIDSMDWADPIPASIVTRVLKETTQQQRGIILFHDIHQQSVLALPRVLNALRVAGVHVGSPAQVGSGK